MEYTGYIILAFVAVAWILFVLFGSVQLFPFGALIFLLIVGCGFLFVKALTERLGNREDDHYSENVDK